MMIAREPGMETRQVNIQLEWYMLYDWPIWNWPDRPFFWAKELQLLDGSGLTARPCYDI